MLYFVGFTCKQLISNTLFQINHTGLTGLPKLMETQNHFYLYSVVKHLNSNIPFELLTFCTGGFIF